MKSAKFPNPYCKNYTIGCRKRHAGEETYTDTKDGKEVTRTVPSAEAIADEINVKTLQGLEVGAERYTVCRFHANLKEFSFDNF